MRFVITILILALLTGCSMKQVRQEFIGTFASDIKNSKNKQVITFDMSGPECINKIKEALTSMKAIVREDKASHYITADNLQKAFRSTIDTTQVGIVVTWLENNKCQVELASDNLDLAIFVSKELSKRLNPKAETQETKEPA